MMSNSFVKSFVVLAVAASLGSVPAAQARQGADDPVGHDAKAVVVTVAPNASQGAQGPSPPPSRPQGGPPR